MRVILVSKSQLVADPPGFERELESTEKAYADADLVAEAAGRLCYLSGHRPNPKTAKNSDYLLNICHQRHYSVLGHSSATFYLDGISRNCSHEIVRHRWFTFSEVSQRYVDATEFEFVQHPGLTGKSVAEKLEPAWRAAQDAYIDVANSLRYEGGCTRKEARQAARSILPGGIETKLMMSGNLRAWRDFLAQRLTEHADAEIRLVALEIYKTLKAEFPNSFQDFDSYGLITVERLVKRAMHRHEAAEAFSHHPRSKLAQEFVEDVREILDKGLWILREDPWKEDEMEDGVR